MATQGSRDPTATAGTTGLSPRYISAVIRWRLWILALWVAVVSASAWVYLSNFRIDNSVAIWFLRDDPELGSYRRYNAEFGDREWTYVWLRSESVFSPEFLRDLHLLGETIESLEDVEQVRSLTGIGILEISGDGIPSTGRFVSAGTGELPDAESAEALRQRIRGSPGLDGKLVPRGDDRFTILAVQNRNHFDSIEPYRIRLIDEIREAVSACPTVLDYGIVGTTVINAELNRAAKRDMFIYYALIAGFVVLGGGLAVGRLRDLLVLCAVVLGTILPVMGVIAALGIAFNLMTVMLPTLLVTVSVSYLIHFISEFHSARTEQEQAADSGNTTASITTTFARLIRPGLWTSVTTAIGFASLTVSPVAPIRHIGLFAAAGIGLAWINTITMVPALLSLLWRDDGSEPRSAVARDRSGWLLRWLARPRPILATILGIAMIIGGAGVAYLQADTDYVKFFRPGSPVRSDYKQLEDIGLPSSYLTVTVRFPDSVRISDPQRHRRLLQFERSLAALPNVIQVDSLDQFVAGAASVIAATHPAGKPESIVGPLLEQAEGGRLDGAGEFLADGGHALQLRVMTGSLSSKDIGQFRRELATLAAKQPEAWEIATTGTNVLWANMDSHVVRTQLLSISITAATLLVLLPLVFRSLVLGLLGFVVSFLPVLCTLGMMAWFGLPVNIATCILGGVVIGLTVDDTIYFLSRVREGLLLELPAGEAAQRATLITGRAMIKTSLILTGGFLTMAASDFMPSVYFGIFFAFSILVALLADLIVLPILLRLAQPLLASQLAFRR
ncbi:MAG: efflux RND transporter permease subunit [Verrucomicrobiales bacterium]